MALGDVIARLSVSLDLQTAAFEKGSKRAEARMSGFQKNMTRASAAVKTAFVGMLGAFAVGELLSVAKAGLDYASSLGEVATQLGISTRSLQEYRYAASQAGIEQGEMDLALGQLTRRLGDAAQGAKPLQAAFAKLGVDIRDSNGHVKDAGDVIPLIAEGLKKIESPAERAAILVDLFGKSGQKLAPLLEGGAAGVNNLRDAANKLGVVLDDGIIQDADDAADKLSAMKQVMEAKIAGFAGQNAKLIVDLADKLLKLAEAALKAANAVAKFVSQDGPGRGNALEENLRIRKENMGQANAGPFRAAAGNRGVWLPGGPGDARVNGRYTRGFRPGLPKGGRGGGGGSRALGSTISLGQSPGAFATKAAESGLVRMAQAANDVDKPIAAVERNLSSVATGAAPKTIEALKKIKVELEQLRSATQGIFDRLFPEEAEARQYAEEINILNTALAKNQITATDHARAILALRREYQEFGAAVEAATVVVSQEFGPSLDDISDSISERFPAALAKMQGTSETTTVRIAKTFNDMAQDVISSVNQISNVIGGGGGKFLSILSAVAGLGLNLGQAGVFGSGFQAKLNKIPGRATGGPISAGRPYMVGERGPELVVPRSDGHVIPNNALGGATTVHIVPSPYFNGVVDSRADQRVAVGAPGIATAAASGVQSNMRQTQARSLP